MADSMKSVTPIHKMKHLAAKGVDTVIADSVNEEGKAVQVLGTLKESGKINYKDKKGLTPTKFLAEATGGKASSFNCNWKDKLRVQMTFDDDSVGDKTVAECLDLVGEPELKVTTDIKKFLGENKLRTLEEIYDKLHSDSELPNFLFRVLRIDESIEDGVICHDDPTTKQTPEDFLLKLFNHVTHGTQRREGCGLVSCTASEEVAAWWSHMFVGQVACIEVKKCGDVRIWNAARTSGKLFPDITESFASKSAEFVLEGSIPKAAVSMFAPSIESRLVSKFGFSAEPALTDLKVKKWFGGTTEAILAEHTVNDRKTKFVVKSGLGGKMPKSTRLDASRSHCAAEYFFLRIYHEFGAAVPNTALFRVKAVSSSSSGSDTSSGSPEVYVDGYVLVTEFIAGRPFRDASGDTLKEQLGSWAWLDLVLRNFDVCGIGYSNLVVQDDANKVKVYRVDCGNNFAFAADGTRLKPELQTLSEAEIRAFRTSSDSMDNVTSKKIVKGHTHQWISSPLARISTLGMFLTDRALSVKIPMDVDILKFKKRMQEILWKESAMPEWRDYLDIVVLRISSLKDMVSVN